MSFDFATLQICKHGVAFEQLTMDVTGQYASFVKPPSSSDVQVYVDRTEVPRTGLLSYAEVPLQSPEPYRIRRGVNDLLYLSLGFEPPRFIQMAPGSVSAKDLALDLQRKIPDLWIGTKNRRVVFRSRQRLLGTAFQFRDPRWTDTTSSLPTTARTLGGYAATGIVPGRAGVGRKLFPGWRVQKDPASPAEYDRRLEFLEPLRNGDPLLEVNYVTEARFCRRCHGVRIEFDYNVKDGTYETVNQTDLMLQEFDKFLVTRIGSHWKWNWLGSGLVDRVGGKGSTGSVNIGSLLTLDVNQAFSTYQGLKSRQDTETPQQRVTDAEFPLTMTGVDVQQLPEDPTVAVIVATVVSRSRQSVTLKRVIGNPSPFVVAPDNPAAYIRGVPEGNFILRG